MVSPYVTDGIIVWTSNYETRIKCLTILEKRAVRVVMGDTYRSSTIIRFEENKIMKFEGINKYFLI